MFCGKNSVMRRMYKVEEGARDREYVLAGGRGVWSVGRAAEHCRGHYSLPSPHTPSRSNLHTAPHCCSWRLISPESYCRSTAQSRRYYKGSSPPSFTWILTWPSIMSPFYSNDHFQPFRGWSLWRFFFSLSTSKNVLVKPTPFTIGLLLVVL